MALPAALATLRGNKGWQAEGSAQAVLLTSSKVFLTTSFLLKPGEICIILDDRKFINFILKDFTVKCI